MLYAIALVLGIVVGLMVKGKFANLVNAKIEKKGIIFGAFILQITSRALSLSGFSYIIKYSLVINGLIFCMLTFALWFNRRYLGILSIALGCLLNAIVIMLNNGKMPVGYEALVKADMTDTIHILEAGADGRHMLLGPGTKFAYLSDIIPVTNFLGMGMKIVSVGDLITVVGLFLLIFELVTNKKLGLKHN